MKLETLYLQEGGKCFFCKKFIPRDKASIEHIICNVPKDNSTENLVMTCKTMNRVLSNKPIKDKLRILLNQIDGGVGFICPMER